MAPSDAVLSLHTIISRPTVAIDGVHYRLVAPDALSLFDRIELEQELNTPRTRLGELLTQTRKHRKSEQKEISHLLDVLCRRVLMAPEPVQRKLTDSQRLLVIEAFMNLPAASRPRAEATGATATRRGR